MLMLRNQRRWNGKSDDVMYMYEYGFQWIQGGQFLLTKSVPCVNTSYIKLACLKNYVVPRHYTCTQYYTTLSDCIK